MPGVPTGRACDACREAKKKCDEAKPSCSRCARLDISCIGAGQQRFQFKEVVKGKTAKSLSGKHQASQALAKRARDNTIISVAASPSASPSNALTTLTLAFVKAIKPATHLKFNLAWTFGNYLEEVPPRLGTNEALDAAADALLAAHSSFCISQTQTVSVNAIKKYSHALRVLKSYLDDPAKACSSNTLCAVALLLASLMFFGSRGRWSGHAEGAAQILKTRKNFRAQSDFEEKLLQSLRGPVLFEGIFNEKLALDSEEWKLLVENKLDGSTHVGRMMCVLARVPNLMQRRQKAVEHANEQDLSNVYQETLSYYKVCKDGLAEVRVEQESIEHLDASAYPAIVTFYARAQYHRLHGLGLTFTVIFNCLLRAFHIGVDELTDECESFCHSLLNIAQHRHMYRPVGDAYIPLCLIAAGVGTDDQQTKTTVMNIMAEYQTNIFEQDMTLREKEIDCFSYQLRTLQPYACPAETQDPDSIEV